EIRRGIRSDPRPSESNAIPSPGFHRIRRIPVGSDKILYWIRWDPMGSGGIRTKSKSTQQTQTQTKSTDLSTKSKSSLGFVAPLNYYLQNSTRNISNNNFKGSSLIPTKNAGSLIVFACAPGTTADDGNNKDKNGLFTKYLSTPNEDIRMILSDITNDVIQQSNNQQIPHVTLCLRHKYICLFNGQKKIKFIRWNQIGKIVAVGNQLNQLDDPTGIFVDRKNHCIIQWKSNQIQGQIIAGGNKEGKKLNQLNRPIDMIIDQQNHSIIIADYGNRRVVRWSTNQKQDILIENIYCFGLTMDQHEFLYVSDWKKNEVKKWNLDQIKENKQGILVAGGNGNGNQLNQLNYPTFIFVDKNQSIYISDAENH
ncbi:unnamed protein product, partial [Adineta ricciae]